MWELRARELETVSYAPIVPVSTLSGCSSTPNVCIRALRISARGTHRGVSAVGHVAGTAAVIERAE